MSTAPRANSQAYVRMARSFMSEAVHKGLDDASIVLATYLHVTPHRTPEGIFRLPIEYILADLRWTRKKIEKSISRLTAAEFIFLDQEHSIVLLRDALKVQIPENPNQIEGVLRRVRELPNTPLLHRFVELAREHCCQRGTGSAAQVFVQGLQQALGERLAQPLPQPLGKPLTLTGTETLTLNSPPSPTVSPLDHPESRERAAVGKEGFESVSSISNRFLAMGSLSEESR